METNTRQQWTQMLPYLNLVCQQCVHTLSTQILTQASPVAPCCSNVTLGLLLSSVAAFRCIVLQGTTLGQRWWQCCCTHTLLLRGKLIWCVVGMILCSVYLLSAISKENANACTYMDMYTYTYIHIYIYTYMYVCIYTYVHLYTYMLIYIFIYNHTCIYVY